MKQSIRLKGPAPSAKLVKQIVSLGMPRLRRTRDMWYQGSACKYLIQYDHAAGRKNDYNVYILTVDDPVTIGRELDLHTVRGLIKDYEAEFQRRADAGRPFFGGRRSAQQVLKAVSSKHRAIPIHP